MESDSIAATGKAALLGDVFPLVGRDAELASLEALLDHAGRTASARFLVGEWGAGKSRLAVELGARAARRGMTVAFGRAYRVERGVPFAVFADAFLPVFRELGREALTVLSRGGEEGLRCLFPALDPAPAGDLGAGAGDPDEVRTRLWWNFVEFLKSYAERAPLLVVLEDLQWADPSSLELVHFVARQSAGHPIFILCTYVDSERDRSPGLIQAERSLVSLGIAMVHGLAPLEREHVTDLVCRLFAVDVQLVREFSAMLYGWTRGNPFFVEEILRALVANGRLTNRRGRWVGWDARDFALPKSIRDAVVTRLSAFSADAQAVAELAAVVGTRTSYPLLSSIGTFDDDALLSALEELRTHGILTERSEGPAVVYDFRHPLVRDTLYHEFGLQRTRVLHGAVAEAMEAYWGERAPEHADELAYHFARADAGRLGGKAVTYLAAAGRRALERHADREAADYLSAAVERARTPGAGAAEGTAPVGLVEDLARARQRLGEYEEAARLWSGILDEAAPGSAEEATLRRALGLATFWCGRVPEALNHLEVALRAARAAGAVQEEVHAHLIRSHCLQEVGRGDEAQAEVAAALPIAERLGDPVLLARVHRSLALLHIWIGPPDAADTHARRAIELARPAGDRAAEFWSRWSLAVLWGMAGDTDRMEVERAEATVLAEELRSPVLRLWTEELAIESAYSRGDWDTGIALGERAIFLARNLNQKRLLPRLLVLTSLFHEGRGDLDRARAFLDEAGDLSGLESAGPHDVHIVVPTYTGLAHYQVAVGDFRDAIVSARKGLDIAEGTGYRLWVVHRLLPILAEACLWAGEIDEAEDVARRLREHSEAQGHKLGLAWADACDALVIWKRGDPRGGARRMREAAEALEAIPMIPYAARLRRQLAGRLAEIGDVEGSLAELRRVHDVFAQLGADLELDKARAQFREIGHRPPPRGVGEGVAGLTARELDIARLVARRRSNKAIAKELGISPRTVSTHLSNIFQKLDLTARAQLGDLVRELGLLDG